MAKVKYNVGTFKGYLGIANIFLAETEGGTQFLVHKVSVTVGGVTSEKFVFTARSAMQSYMLSGDGVLSSNIDLSKMADTAPTGVLDADGYAIIDNGTDVPRIFNSNAFYSIKGEGINDFTGDVGTPVSGKEMGKEELVHRASHCPGNFRAVGLDQLLRA
jgi:hypothetical protein